MKKLSLSALALFTAMAGFSNVTLPKVFGNQMVLQRNQAIPVWGWADKNEKITIQFNKQTKTVKAGKDGKWKIALDAEAAGGPYTLVVKGKNTVTFTDVLVGEVWVCSGQSNMEFHVSGTKNAVNEISSANYPQIRQIEVVKDLSGVPLEDLKHTADWKPATSDNVKDFTAVGYFFARDLYNKLHVPIGLIHTSWGGTEVETWTSREAFQNSDEFKNMISAYPHINTDSIGQLKKAELQNKITALQGSIPDANTVATWKNADYNDAKWPDMKIPALWETQQLPDFDGIVWFRKTIDIAAEDAGKPAEIELGMIDDADATYVNGTAVGGLNGYNVKRVYNIPAGVLKAGKNVIAVRVQDTGGGGGIYGDAEFVKLTVGSKVLSLAGSWKFQIEGLINGNPTAGPNDYPTLLFNAMINPIIPYGIKGAIWYQGESNASRAYQYRKAFPLMISDWRQRWNEGNFPFYFVQLATFNSANGTSKNGSAWAELREAQAMTLALPNTGMSITTDIGEPGDIHPKNKQDVGKRLAAIALHDTYDIEGEYEGPVFQSVKVENGKAVVSYTHTGSGLYVKDKYGYVKGFEIAGADQQFHYAQAIIKGDKIIVWQDGLANPVAVRYNWADDASDGNLFNKEGFPAAPFRTDDWKAVTAEVKYKVN
ncbi:sialate O-acetylesterase [Pinibacter aurantiacus]|uniref:9-O-acetylesterase n=1 Tax=Pinibacter aurantiacus TaxID=2851599 RepID=A0A9E2SBQ5_9BACT|nr:sialate O-acetylesterase [Pinibacter aurantiacus]MBV4358417.1 9-O-acetylesterase [Pinibacter aurantiacus]